MHRFSLRIQIIFFLFLGPFTVFCQEQLGMRIERYAGIYSASINPAYLADNPGAWDVSLFSADVFLENSYAYLKNTSLPRALRHSGSIVSITDTSLENPAGPDNIVLDFFSGKQKLRAVAQARLAGPGFSFRLGNNQFVGLSTAFRSEVSSYSIPQILAYKTVSDLPRNEAQRIGQTGLNGMAWGEIALHYSRSNSDSDLKTTWGVSPKLLLGFEGFYTRARTEFDYTQRPNDTVAFGSGNWDYALTLGNAADPDNARLRRQGTGMGLDAGISWSQSDETGYDWRFGVSVLDLGYVRFNRNAQKHHIAFDTLLTVSNADFPPRDRVTELISDVSQAFLDNPAASLQARSFSIGLPTALSVQFDKHLDDHLFVSALIVQRMPLWSHSVKRPNTLAVVPRYEQRWFSFSLPVVLDDWRSLRVGAAARLGWLYIGSDNLGSFFQKRKLTGTDFYIGLKINAFKINVDTTPKLKRESRPRHPRQKWRKIRCYQF